MKARATHVSRVATFSPQTRRKVMNTNDTYLAVFISNNTSPRWQAWYAMSDEERRAKEQEGFAALKAWDEKHRDAVVYEGGPLGPTKRTSPVEVKDVVNELTVFVVLRAPSHEAAAKMFEGHPYFTIFPCDAVDVSRFLAPSPARRRGLHVRHWAEPSNDVMHAFTATLPVAAAG